MKHNRKTYLFMLLFPLLVSCSGQTTTSQEDISSDSTDISYIPSISESEISSQTAEEDIFDMGYTNIRIDGVTYYQLKRGLYVNKMPGQYLYGFDLKFAYNKKEGKLYYNYDGEKPILNDLCYLAPYKAVKIYENIPESDDEIPLSTSVDEILKNYDNRLVSYNYINNIQNPGNYQYFNNAISLSISFIYKEIQTDMALTYLVDDDNTYDIPLVFLSMPYKDWFGNINNFYNNIYEEIEKYGTLEYYDPISGDYFQRTTKIKLGGGWSKGYPQRTLNVNFNKDEKGNKNEKVTVSIFGERKTCGDTEKDLTKFIRFRLHNGGNCFESWSGFNDAIIQQAMFDSNVATSAYRPCLAYLNGEYWGLMSLREHYSDYYIQQNYGVDNKNVTMFEVKGDIVYDDGDENGVKYINELKTLIDDSRFKSNNQNQLEAAFQDMAEMIDIDSFIDCLLTQTYACNWDFVGNWNNLKMWRSMKTSNKDYEDGKWRFCLHDLDFAFTDTTNFLSKYANNSYNNWGLVKSLMKCKTFRTLLVERAEELISFNLSMKHLSDITLNFYKGVKIYKKDFARRWGQPDSFYNDWMNYYSYLLNYYQTRSSGFVNELKTILNNQYGGY